MTFSVSVNRNTAASGSVVAKALCYKPEARGFDTRYGDFYFDLAIPSVRPPLWSSGQSSWLEIRRPGFDSQHYQKKNVVGLERSALSLVSTN
jgi:hypothetical protein